MKDFSDQLFYVLRDSIDLDPIHVEFDKGKADDCKGRGWIIGTVPEFCLPPSIKGVVADSGHPVLMIALEHDTRTNVLVPQGALQAFQATIGIIEPLAEILRAAGLNPPNAPRFCPGCLRDRTMENVAEFRKALVDAAIQATLLDFELPA